MKTFEIYKIVTARNTAFIVGYPMDMAENSPTINQIEQVCFDNVGQFSYCRVYYSNGHEVAVRDVVEVWDK